MPPSCFTPAPISQTKGQNGHVTFCTCHVKLPLGVVGLSFSVRRCASCFVFILMWLTSAVYLLRLNESDLVQNMMAWFFVGAVYFQLVNPGSFHFLRAWCKPDTVCPLFHRVSNSAYSYPNLSWRKQMGEVSNLPQFTQTSRNETILFQEEAVSSMPFLPWPLLTCFLTFASPWGYEGCFCDLLTAQVASEGRQLTFLWCPSCLFLHFCRCSTSIHSNWSWV